MMLKGKTIVLGVTGSIAAYKIPNLASMLKKEGADVHIIMTENATNFITATTFETITGNKCLVDTFDRNFQFHVAHVSLAKKADFMLIAPASANIVGKVANGIADDMLSTTVMACQAPVHFAPAMNSRMYVNKIFQSNMDKLKEFGYSFIEPASGHLACNEDGIGKMPEPAVLFQHILFEIAKEKDYKGKHVLVTAGATQEYLDPVRYISNPSTGKMGYAVAKNAAMRGAKVTLISAAATIAPPENIDFVKVVTADEMYEQVMNYLPKVDIVIKSAAVADYKPLVVNENKVKKQDGSLVIEFERTKDILKQVGEIRREDQYICGFSMETEDLIKNSSEKRKKKKIDMIIANNLKEPGAGFQVETNKVTILSDLCEKQLPMLSKDQVAEEILNQILLEVKEKNKK